MRARPPRRPRPGATERAASNPATRRHGALTLHPAELIARTRDGEPLSDAEVDALVAGIAGGGLSDAQVGAWAMAARLRGLSAPERARLTGAMARSGRTLEWRGLPGPVLDKHSTGGVGDKVSLLLAPVVAACGGCVPMISGRGLGHTGGTLDKLEAIPGYDVAPGLDRLRAVVAEAGCAIVGAGPDLAPADRRLYAVRDATATVDCEPLIVASILSKKLAAGLDALVLDVKAGSGAFLPGRDAARSLARALVAVARDNGLACSALLTDMDQVLGRAAGNALEVGEAVAALTGEGDERLVEVTLALAAELLALGGIADGRAAAERALASGAAAERLGRMVAALGGPADLVEAPWRHLPRAPLQRPATSAAAGVVTAIDVRAVGLAIVELGGGRAREDAAVDPAVGLTEVARLGEAVGERPLALVHARDELAAQRAVARLQAAFAVGDEAPPVVPLVEAVDG